MIMPSARRAARRSVSMLMGMGVPRRDAANVVMAICDEAAGVIWRRDRDMDVNWLAAIRHEAMIIAQGSPATPDAVREYADHVALWAVEFDQQHGAQPHRHYHPDVNPEEAVSVVSAALDVLKMRRYRRPGA